MRHWRLPLEGAPLAARRSRFRGGRIGRGRSGGAQCARALQEMAMNAPLTEQALERHEPRPVPPAMLAALRSRFGERCSTTTAVREAHGRDESTYPTTPPDAVVFCESTEDVAAAVALAAAYAVPVIPFGVGSSLEGHLLAVQGGLSIDLSRMTKLVAVNPEDLTVTVQAGVTREQLNREIKDAGLFFPIDPGANASIGGMAATRASGTNAVRYGTMRENVLGLTVVTARSGQGSEVIRTGTRAKKSSAGYDLTRLFVGSEGTLGVMTEITLKLYPLPEAVSAAICHFPSIDAAVRTTIQIIQMGVPIARCELLDANAIRAVNQHSKLTLREQTMLLMEFHGSDAGVAEQAATVQEIAREHGGADFQWARTPEERTRLWTARHQSYFAALQVRPGCRCLSTDTCVPISRLAESINASVDEADASGIPYWIVGHVGDGNFHLSYLLDPADPAEAATVEKLSEQMVQRAIRLGGTCTGEHGIGLHKIGYLVDEAGAGAVETMKSIKRALDPLNIMNPGKVLRM
jgi:D-lactate dehydrogenase (cytochrome)